MTAHTIVLSGPGKNSLTTELLERTLASVRAAGERPILLTGEGDTFCAGLNLKEVVTLDAAKMARFLGTLEDLVQTLYEYPGPVVGWINGHAIAGGCVLALACDYRVLTSRPGPLVGLNELALGLHFPPLTFAMVKARVPRASVERVVLEGGLYEAPLCHALGLVDVVGEEADARAALERLSAHPRDVYAATKLAIRGRLSVSDEEQRRFREETIPYWADPARRDRILAVLNRGGRRASGPSPE